MGSRRHEWEDDLTPFLLVPAYKGEEQFYFFGNSHGRSWGWTVSRSLPKQNSKYLSKAESKASSCQSSLWKRRPLLELHLAEPLCPPYSLSKGSSRSWDSAMRNVTLVVLLAARITDLPGCGTQCWAHGEEKKERNFEIFREYLWGKSHEYR